MKTLIKLDLNKLISNKLLFLLFGLTIFSMDERITQTLSSQQFILYIFTEHYYLTYLMMPFSCCQYIAVWMMIWSIF